jgi:hypothetical protein
MQLRLTTTYYTDAERRGKVDTYVFAAKYLQLPTTGLIQGKLADAVIGWKLVTPPMSVTLDALQQYGVLGAFTPVKACTPCDAGLEDGVEVDAHALPPWPTEADAPTPVADETGAAMETDAV